MSNLTYESDGDLTLKSHDRAITLTLCPLCRQYIKAIQEAGRTNPLPAPHPKYHPCRSPETPEEQTVWNYMSIGRLLQFEQFGFWPPVEASLYELCPPRLLSLSVVPDPSLPSAPPSKHSIYQKELYEQTEKARVEGGFAPSANSNHWR